MGAVHLFCRPKYLLKKPIPKPLSNCKVRKPCKFNRFTFNYFPLLAQWFDIYIILCRINFVQKVSISAPDTPKWQINENLALY